MFQDDIGQTADSAKKDDTDELVGGHREYSLYLCCFVRFPVLSKTFYYIL